MNAAAFVAIAPLLSLSVGVVVLMLQVAVKRSSRAAFLITVATLAGSALSVFWAGPVTELQVTPLLLADRYALFFSLLFCVCGVVTAVIARDYLRARGEEQEEFFLLLILSTLGAVTLAYATHLASLLLGLELLGVALYALIAYPDRGNLPLEAAIKYLVLSGAASAVFLFGFALLYAATGALSFEAIGQAARAADPAGTPLLLAGAAMILAGLGFKLSLVPFHLWTPDVYEGAPAPVSGFLAAVSKSAVFAAVLRWWLASDLHEFEALVIAASLLAGLSMLVGNLLALLQENIKRLLAYSSIAHVGYLLIVLVACGLSPRPELAVEAACFYLAAYTATTLAAFGLVGLVSANSSERELNRFEDLQGLFWRAPGLALLLTVALLSLAGIPLTAGFIGKFYLFVTGVDSALWGLLALLVIGSAIGIYYYLRLVYAMTLPPAGNGGGGENGDGGDAIDTGISAASRAVCYALVALMLYLGTLPGLLMDWLKTII